MRQRSHPFRFRVVPYAVAVKRPRGAPSRCLNSDLLHIFGEGLLEATRENLEKALGAERPVPFRNIFTHVAEGIWWLSNSELRETRRQVYEKLAATSPETAVMNASAAWKAKCAVWDRAAGELLLEGLVKRGYPV